MEYIGHELAHTFFYNLEQDPPEWLTGSPGDNDEERFCEDFAIRWAELNKDKFEPILRKWRENQK